METSRVLTKLPSERERTLLTPLGEARLHIPTHTLASKFSLHVFGFDCSFICEFEVLERVRVVFVVLQDGFE